MASDGDDVWFAYETVIHNETRPWLLKTTSTGEVLKGPTEVASSYGFRGDLTLAVTDSSVVVGYRASEKGDRAFVRVFDRDGFASEPEPHRVALTADMAEIVYGVEVVPAPGGGSRLVATIGDGLHEIAMVELDAAGQPTGGSVLGGADDEGQTWGLAAAHQSDGSLLVAWDRGYDPCTGPVRPSLTMTVAIDPDLVAGPISTVHEAPERSNTTPVLASAGDTTYLAWETYSDGMWRVALARYPALDAPVEIVDAAWPLLALAEPGRGAIAWYSDEMYVAQFEQAGNDLVVGTPLAIPRVNPGLEVYGGLTGLVHVGGNRYVVGWHEETQYPNGHFYATRIDFDEPRARTATRPTPEAKPLLPRRAPVPCTH